MLKGKRKYGPWHWLMNCSFQTAFPLVFLQAELWEYTCKFLITKRRCWLNPNLDYLRTTKVWEKCPWRTFWYLSSVHIQTFFFTFNLCDLQKQLQQRRVAHHTKSDLRKCGLFDIGLIKPTSLRLTVTHCLQSLLAQWFYRQNCFSFLWILVGRLQALKCFLNSSH